MSVGLCIRTCIIRQFGNPTFFPYPNGVGLCRFYYTDNIRNTNTDNIRSGDRIPNTDIRSANRIPNTDIRLATKYQLSANNIRFNQIYQYSVATLIYIHCFNSRDLTCEFVLASVEFSISILWIKANYINTRICLDLIKLTVIILPK